MYSYRVETSSPTAPISDNSLTPTVTYANSTATILIFPETTGPTFPVTGISGDWEEVEFQSSPPPFQRRRRPVQPKVKESKMRFGFQQMARIPNYRGVRTR